MKYLESKDQATKIRASFSRYEWSIGRRFHKADCSYGKFLRVMPSRPVTGFTLQQCDCGRLRKFASGYRWPVVRGKVEVLG